MRAPVREEEPGARQPNEIQEEESAGERERQLDGDVEEPLHTAGLSYSISLVQNTVLMQCGGTHRMGTISQL